MNLLRLFILRPVATTLLMLAIMVSGLLSFKFLPVSALPEVDYPTILIQTFYSGASPDIMANTVTAPLETQLGKLSRLEQMISQSSGGASVIKLRFSFEISMDTAEQEVQEAINQASYLLPTDLPSPPIYAKVNPADAPILTLGITSRTLALTNVQDYIQTRLAQKISQTPGVGLIFLIGGNRKAIRIQVDIPKLTAYGLTLDNLRTTIQNVNVATPTGGYLTDSTNPCRY